MNKINSTQVRTSRYVSGGVTEVNSSALEWWERSTIPIGSDDITYVVEKKFEGRLDLIAAMFLGEPRYWWVIAQYNNVLDPHDEIIEGNILYIPSQTRVSSMLDGRIGGIASTREVPTSILPIV
jgi:hypothetical protein